MNNSFCIHIDSLLEFWGPNTRPTDVTEIVVNVSLWKKLNFTQEEKPIDEVHIFEQCGDVKMTADTMRRKLKDLFRSLQSQKNGSLSQQTLHQRHLRQFNNRPLYQNQHRPQFGQKVLQ